MLGLPEEAVEECSAAKVALAEDDFNDAIALFQKLLAVAPDNLFAHFGMATAQADLGDLGSALQSFERARELDPNFGIALHSMGYVLADMKRWEEPLVAFEEALGLSG